MIGPSCSFGPGVPTTISATGEEYIVPLAKPIRIVQFVSESERPTVHADTENTLLLMAQLLVTLLFALTIYTISRKSPYEYIEGTLLTLLYGSFLFIALIDIISQFGGDPIPDTPMFLFGVVGTVLFLIATFGVLFNYMRESHEESWRLIATMALSGACSLLYLLDVLVIFLYGY